MERVHPTEKSVVVLSSIIDDYCGDVVLDPFAGGGTTVRVAVASGRPATGVDLNRDFCAYMVKELQKL